MSIETSQESQKPEVSPETRQLIELCSAVAQGAAARVPELETRLQERQKGLSTAWENFAKGQEAETDEVAEMRKPMVEAVEAQYQAYAQALEKITAYLSERKPELLNEAATALSEAGPSLRAAIISYDMAILMSGKSRFPDINLFENLARRLQAGQLPLPVWRATCQGHQQFYTGLIKEIDGSEKPQEPGIPERRAAANTILGCLQRLEALTPTSSQTEVDAILQLMTQAYTEMEAAINTYNYHTLSETPTASPEANRVIHAAQWALEGKGPKELMQAQAAYYQERVKKSISELQVATRLSAGSTMEAEEGATMLASMEAMDEALEVLKTRPEEAAEITTALAAFQAAVERLNQSYQAVQEHAESRGKTLCPHCQAPNVPGARMCEKCQRRLPDFAGSDVYGSWTNSTVQMAEGNSGTGGRDMVVTRTMKELQDACMAYEKGTMTQEEFLAHIRSQEEKVRTAELKMARLKLPEVPADASPKEKEQVKELMHFGTDAIGLLAQGVGLCMNGLMKLEKYVAEDSVSDMRDGLREFFEGCQKLTQIERVAKDLMAALPAEDGGEAEAPAAEEETEAGAAHEPADHVAPIEDDDSTLA